MHKLLLPSLFLIAFLERVAFDLGPNTELVTLAMILSYFYFGQRKSFWLIFLIMLFSDLIIGNTNIFIFTWSGFLLPIFFVKYFSRSINGALAKALKGTFAGILSNGFFFIWTNFGVWLLSEMYPKTGAGLLISYINALPFLRYQLTSTLIFIPLGFVLVEFALSAGKKWQLERKLNILFNSKFKIIN